MHRDVISRRSAVLADCTGLSHAQARRHLETAPPHAALLPTATPAQALLERWILASLARPINGRLYPWGIRSVQPFAEHLVLQLEGDHVATEAVESLLPRLDKHDSVHGVPGLRVGNATREGATLWLAGSPATVTLRGIRPSVWHRAVQTEEDDAVLAGERLCHRDAEWSTAERTWLTDVELLGERADIPIAATAWLFSGLLRRIGLLRSLGVPVSADAWTKPVDSVADYLVVELIMEEVPLDAPRHHERFIELLTGPDIGMPLQVERRSCRCPAEDLPSSCTFDLVASNGAAGRLQLRIRRFPALSGPEETAARWEAWRPLRALGREDMAGRC